MKKFFDIVMPVKTAACYIFTATMCVYAVLDLVFGWGGLPDNYLFSFLLLSLAGGVLLALPMALLRTQGMERALSLTPLRALAVGLVEGVGTVVPGLSTSFILINLGWYQAYLDALAHPQAGLLALVALGFAASALVSMKAVQWLFDHARGYTCYAVLGFLLVSVALVFPGFGSGWTLWAQLAALLAGLLVARWMGGLGEPVATTSKG